MHHLNINSFWHFHENESLMIRAMVVQRYVLSYKGNNKVPCHEYVQAFTGSMSVQWNGFVKSYGNPATLQMKMWTVQYKFTFIMINRTEQVDRNELNHNTKVMLYYNTSSPHIVHVVSMLDVPNKFGSTSFQSKDVSGAQKSEFLFCENKEITIHNFPECNGKL